MFKGSVVALITPFRNGQIDEKKLRALVEFQIKNGTSALVPCGTTGESATLGGEEQQRVIEITIEAADHRVPVIAGTGANDTAKAIKHTLAAQKVGADGALLVTPYYNKPTQEGLFRHYEAVARETSLPLILYNVPGRTGVNLLPETVARLAKIENIVGIKEASGNLDQVSAIVHLCGPDFAVLSGDDSLTLPMMALGGVGVVSVAANIAPREVAAMVDAFLRGDPQRAKEMHYQLFDLFKALFIETNPIPVKTAAALMGLCELEFRLPLCPMSETNLKKLKETLAACQLVPVA
ncbi:MAG: 4-hydroxy-tetrahydrodipicolinate synthase [Chloroflexi bacterium]|nr:4-hydroxy-tetrahydrodipicolinate synthase [Chloroflexota bacterium]MCL5074926.1 4-hydroxy-tetrahydrodipicolinate synthase [Chloroflexota bacterium]